LLTQISLQNLACFGEGDNHIDLAPETVIIGPNNVGKSAFIAGFNALHAFVHYGTWQWGMPRTYPWNSFDDIVHRHELGREIHLGASVQGTDWSGAIHATVSRERGASLAHPRTSDMIRELDKVWLLRASRVELQHRTQIGSVGPYLPWQPLNPDGSNVIPYLLERYTSRDPHWAEAENWLKRIAPETSVLKAPLRVINASVETADASQGVDINMAYQGTGIQKALSIIAAVVFSPEGSTIIIEEPETNLHPRSQESLVDLFNLAVRDWKKQVIFSTHSWDMLLPFASDIATGSKRGEAHIRAEPENFKLVVLDRMGGDVKIHELDMKGKEFKDIRDYLKRLWG